MEAIIGIGIIIVVLGALLLGLKTTGSGRRSADRSRDEHHSDVHSEVPVTPPRGEQTPPKQTVENPQTEQQKPADEPSNEPAGSEQALNAFSEQTGLRWSKNRGGKIAFPAEYRYRPVAHDDSQPPVRLGLGKRLYGRYQDQLIEMAEVLWRQQSTAELQGLCASMIDHSLPDFELRQAPPDEAGTDPAQAIASYPGLADGWWLISAEPEATQARLQPEAVAYWVEQGLQVQAIGGQLLITRPHCPPERVALLTVDNAQCLLDALTIVRHNQDNA